MFGLGQPRNLVADSVLASAQMERDLRRRRVNVAWDRYWGKHPKPLKVTGTDPNGDDNTTVNLSRKTVDISAFYLFGKSLKFEVGGKGDEPADEWLAKCWEANRAQTMLLEFATSAGVAGDGYLRLYPARSPGAAGRDAFPRIVSLDAANVDVVTDPVDVDRVLRYVIEFTSVDLLEKRATAHRHVIEQAEDVAAWRILEQESVGDKRDWVTVSEEDWPFAFCPILHCKNLPAPHCFFGRSDIEEDVLDLNAAISFVASNVNRILRVHGHPMKYITGQAVKDLDAAIDSVLYLPNPEAKAGAMPYVENLESHFGQLQKLRDAYHELTGIPEIATGKVENIGQLSGLALQILYGPLTRLTDVKRKFYGELLVEVCRALLELGGFDGATGLPVTITWPQMLPTNRKEEAETSLILGDVGVSRETRLTELGYDAAQETERSRTESEVAALAQSVAFDRGIG
jgi:hypothetical protein